MNSLTDLMAEAKALTLKGQLMDATRLIQARLGTNTKSSMPVNARDQSVGEVVTNLSDRTIRAAQPSPTWTAHKSQAVDIDFRDELKDPARSQSEENPLGAVPASFTLHKMQSEGQSYPYRLFVPSGASLKTALPIVLMLHGCKQNADDFARGTAMNAIAEREKFIVVYPEQNRQGNSMGCWNWFEPKHQQRGRGEPAMIAALVAHLVTDHVGDSSRVYVAGLSAGGAMAALVGQLYPELFAAVGVHSGLGPAAAHDVASAFSAMRKGPSARFKSPISLPIIVFQGSGDKTVAPSNAQSIVKTELDALQAMEVHLQYNKEDASLASGRKATRERWSGTDGKCLVESWNVSNAPHAWAGGDSAGTFTDPQGPSASEAMFRFFRLHSK